MKNNNKKNINVLFINAGDYTALDGADFYTHRLIELINKNYDASITEFSYDMCIYKNSKVNTSINNVKVIFPSNKRNFRDERNLLTWAFTNYWNTTFRAERKIWKIFKNNLFDIIINGSMILYGDKRLMSLSNFITIQHQSYDFVLMKHYKFWTWLAQILTYLYGTRNCFKRSRNLMLCTEFDKVRILKECPTKFERKIFITPNSRFKKSEMDDFWNKRLKTIVSDKYEHDCIFVGRICKQQKRVHLLDAVAKYLNFNVSCVGGGTYSDKLKKNKLIKTYDLLLPKQVPEKYINSKVSILLSDYEAGTPGSITEALACGTPTITTINNEGVRYLKSKLGDAIQIINVKLTGKKLANEIQKAYDIITHDKNKYKKMCQECMNFAKSELSIEVFENNWINAIETLVEK